MLITIYVTVMDNILLTGKTSHNARAKQNISVNFTKHWSSKKMILFTKVKPTSPNMLLQLTFSHLAARIQTLDALRSDQCLTTYYS